MVIATGDGDAVVSSRERTDEKVAKKEKKKKSKLITKDKKMSQLVAKWSEVQVGGCSYTLDYPRARFVSHFLDSSRP